MPDKLPSYNEPVQVWLDAGLAVVSGKHSEGDFGELSFAAAQAKGLVHLTGEGAMELEREAPRPDAPSGDKASS